MKILYKQGDLLDATETYILHGVNCQGVMASGVAKAIRAKWPITYTVYKASEQENGMLLGNITYCNTEDGKTIFNAITQEFYGRDGRQYVSYTAIAEVMQRLNWLLRPVRIEHKIQHVAMPKIGAGLGDWDIISEIIEHYSTNFQPVVYQLEPVGYCLEEINGN